MPEPLPPPHLDLVRFGYVLKHRIEAEGFSYRDVRRLTGVPITQVCRAVNGRPVEAGATHVLAVAFGIDLDTMLAAATAERLRKIRRQIANENGALAVSPPVSREAVEHAT